MSHAMFLVLALLAATAAVEVVRAQSPASCTGRCLRDDSLFDPATATVCDKVDISVRGTRSGIVIGGDTFRWDSDIASAAVHTGLVGSGDTEAISVFWAGTRPSFAPIVRNGVTSTGSDTADGGVILAAAGASCPSATFSPTMTPVVNIDYDNTGSVFGTTWYRFDSTVNRAAAHMGFIPDETSAPPYSGTLYLHHSATNHRVFPRSRAFGMSSTWASDHGAGQPAYTLSSSTTTPEQNDSAIRVYFDGTLQRSCRGFGAYDDRSMLNGMLIHSGLATEGVPGWFWIHVAESPRTWFYESLQNGIRCHGYANENSPRLALIPSTNSSAPHDFDRMSQDGNVTTGMMYLDELDYTPVLVGTTVYKYDSDFNHAAFHSGLMALGTVHRVYIHYIGRRRFFYSNWYRGVRSQSHDAGSGRDDHAAYVSFSSSPPTDADLKRVYINMNKQRSVRGLGYYRHDSEIGTSAVHAGFVKPGRTRVMYLQEFTPNFFFGGDMRGINSPDFPSSDSAFYLTANADDPNPWLTMPFAFDVVASMYTCNDMVGVGIYHFRTDIACGARHAGLIGLGEQATVWVHDMGKQTYFRGAYMNGLRSRFDGAHASGMLGVALSLRSTPPFTARDGAASPVPFLIDMSDMDTSANAFGAGVFTPHSDVRLAAFLDGVVNIDDPRQTVWIHPTSGLQGYPSVCRGQFCAQSIASTSVASTVEHPTHAFSVSASPNASLARAGPNSVRTFVQYSPEFDTATIHGFRETGYRADSSISKMAAQSGLAKPYEATTVYYHFVANVTTGFVGSFMNGVESRDHETERLALLVTASSTMPAFNQSLRPFTACYNNTNEAADLWGTHVFSYRSDVQQAAYADYLLDYGGPCKTLYMHAIGEYPGPFFASRTRDLESRYRSGADTAFILTETGTLDPAENATITPVRLSMAYHLPGTGTTVYGAGIYSENSDLATAAYIEGLLPFGDERATQLYVHHIGEQPEFYEMNNRGIFSRSTSTNGGIVLSRSAESPNITSTIPIDLVYSSVSTLPESSCQGVSFFQRRCDVLTAAVYLRLIRPGESKRLYLHRLGPQPFFPGAFRDGFGAQNAYLAASSSAEREAFTLTDSSTSFSPIDASTGAIRFEVNITEMPTGGKLVGTDVYSKDSCVVTAAYHMGLVRLGAHTVLYVHDIGTYNGPLYSSTRRGLVSSAADPGEEAIVITTSATPPPSPNTTFQAVTITAERHPMLYSQRGCGYYHLRQTDIVGAALWEGLLRPGETKTVYVTNTGDRAKLHACHGNGFVVGPVPTFFVSLLLTPHTPIANVTPAFIQPLNRYVGGSTAGAFVFRDDSNVEEAAVMTGLLNLGESAVLYLHDIDGSNARFYSATSAGLRSTSNFDAAAQAMIVSASATPPSGDDLPSATVTKVTIVWDPSQSFDTIRGTGRYHHDGDVAAMAWHVGLFDETTPMPFTFFVHELGAGGPLYPSTFRGVTSNSRSSLTSTLISVSTSSSAAPACMTGTDTYAPVQGVTDTGLAYGGPQYYYNSDVNLAAVHRGLVGIGERRVVRLSRVTATGSPRYPSSTANGVETRESSTTNDEAFTLSTASCSFFTVSSVTSAPTIDCVDDCSASHFTVGSTAVGTQATVVVQGVSTEAVSGTLYGSGYYPMEQPWNVLATHAGVVSPGEVKTVYVYYVGERTEFVGSRMHGVSTSHRSYGSGVGAVMFSATVVTPNVTAGVTPVMISFSAEDTAYGIGHFTLASDLATAAYLSHAVTPFQAPVLVHVFDYPSASRRLFGARHRGIESRDSSPTTEVFIVTNNTTAAAPAAPGLTTEVTLECDWFSHSPLTNGYGHGYFREDVPLCDAAQHLGWYTGSDVQLTFFVHDEGDRRDFVPGGTGVFNTMLPITSRRYVYALSTESTHTFVPNVSPVYVDARFDLLHTGDLWGSPDSYFRTSDVKSAALHEGLLREGSTWRGFVHGGIGSKSILPAFYSNGLRSASRANSAHDVFAFSTNGTVHMGIDPFGPSSVTRVDVGALPFFQPGSIYGYHSVYGEESEVVTAAHHSGWTSNATPGEPPRRLYLHFLSSIDQIMNGVNHGIRSEVTTSRGDVGFVFSSSPTSYDPEYVTSGKVTIKLHSLFNGNPTRGFHVYEDTADVGIAAWQSGLIPSFGVDTEVFVHYVDATSTFRNPAGVANGFASDSVRSRWFFVSTSANASDASTSPVVAEGEHYVFRGVRLPNLSPAYLTAGVSASHLMGAGKYDDLMPVTAAAFHSGLLALGGPARDIHLHWYSENVPALYGATFHGLTTTHGANAAAYTLSLDGINAQPVLNLTHVRLSCANHVFSAPQPTGTVVYNEESDLCAAAQHDGRLDSANYYEAMLWVHTIADVRHFVMSMRHGVWSKSTAHTGSSKPEGLAFSPTTVAPEINMTSLRVTNLQCMSSALSTSVSRCWGAMHFREQTDFSLAAMVAQHCRYLDVLPTVYLHDVGWQEYYPELSYKRVWRCRYSNSNSRHGLWISANETFPENAGNGTKQEFTVDTTSFIPHYGTSVVEFSSDLAAAAYFAGIAKPGVKVRLFAYWLYRRVKHFYATDMYGLASLFVSYGSVRDAWVVHSSDAYGEVAPLEIDDVRQPVNLTVGQYRFAALVGTTYYAETGRLSDMAFHSSILSVDESGMFWVHHVVTPNKTYGSTMAGLKTSTLGSNRQAVTLTGGPFPPDPTQPLPVVVVADPDPVRDTPLTGTGIYAEDTDVSEAAFHSGLVDLGERAQVYVHRVDSHDMFLASVRDGVRSEASFTAQPGFFVWTSPNPPPCIFSPTSTSIRVSMPAQAAPVETSERVSANSSLFTTTSNVSSAVYKEGLVGLGGAERIVIHFDRGTPAFTVNHTLCGVPTVTVSHPPPPTRTRTMSLPYVPPMISTRTESLSREDGSTDGNATTATTAAANATSDPNATSTSTAATPPPPPPTPTDPNATGMTGTPSASTPSATSANGTTLPPSPPTTATTDPRSATSGAPTATATDANGSSIPVPPTPTTAVNGTPVPSGTATGVNGSSVPATDVNGSPIPATPVQTPVVTDINGSPVPPPAQPQSSRTATTSLSIVDPNGGTPAPLTPVPRTATPSITVEQLPEPRAADPPHVMAAPLETAADSTVAATAATSIAASPGAVAQATRIASVVGMARLCALENRADREHAALYQRLGFPRSFVPGLSIGSARGGYLRGAIVVNFSAVIVFLLLVGSVGSLIAAVGPKPRSAKVLKAASLDPPNVVIMALRLARAPTSLAVIIGAGMSGSLVAATILLVAYDVDESDPADVPMIVIAFIGHLVALTLAVQASWRMTHASADDYSARVGDRPGVSRPDQAQQDALSSYINFLPARLMKKPSKNSSSDDASLLNDPYKSSASDDGEAKVPAVTENTNAVLAWLVTGSFAWLPPAAAIGGKSYSLHIAIGRALHEHFSATVARYRGVPCDRLVRQDELIRNRFRRGLARMCPWFFVFELLTAIIAAMAEGVAVHSCHIAMAVALCANMLMLFLAIVLLPYNIPTKNVLLVLICLLTSVASIVSLAALEKGNYDDREVQLGHAARIAFAAGIFILLSITLSLLRIVVVKIFLGATEEIDPARMRAAEGVRFSLLIDEAEVDATTRANPTTANGLMDDDNDDPLMAMLNPRRASTAAAASRPLLQPHSVAVVGGAAASRRGLLDTSSDEGGTDSDGSAISLGPSPRSTTAAVGGHQQQTSTRSPAVPVQESNPLGLSGQESFANLAQGLLGGGSTARHGTNAAAVVTSRAPVLLSSSSSSSSTFEDSDFADL